jgi:hypothetical protein
MSLRPRRASAHCTNTDSIDLICKIIMPVA